MTLLKKRRGFAGIVGGVFIVIIISTAIAYSALSMEQISQVAETVEIKQTSDFQKATEEFKVVKIETVDSQFNMTVTNSGDIPVQLTRLWVENTTDSTWPIAKYDLNELISPGYSATNIGQNIGLTALNTQSYEMKLVTERGNTEKMLLNSVGNDSLYLNLRATPTIISTGFSTTLILEVINTGTNNLLNLQAEMDSALPNCSTECFANKVTGPLPLSFDSLDPGDIATFEWVYTIDAPNSGDQFTFTASLVNDAVGSDSVVVTVHPAELAENVSVSLESQAVTSGSLISDDMLIFHEEQVNVPNGGYQLMSMSPDAGNDGTRLASNGTGLPLSPISFMTTNGSNSVIVPAGTWNATLWIDSAEDPITTGSPGAPDIKYHMEDGPGVNPDNSRTSSTGSDLTQCGGTGWCSLGSAICDTSWDNRFEITIDNTKVAGSSDHTNFPVMINVTGSTFTTYLDDADDSINDIRFT